MDLITRDWVEMKFKGLMQRGSTVCYGMKQYRLLENFATDQGYKIEALGFMDGRQVTAKLVISE